MGRRLMADFHRTLVINGDVYIAAWDVKIHIFAACRMSRVSTLGRTFNKNEVP